MPLTHTRSFPVRYYECDTYAHLNNGNYLRYMQEAAFDASRAAGYDNNRYHQLNAIWLIRDTEVEFLRPLRYGDTVEVKTWVGDFGRVRSRRLYEFHVTGSEELYARGSTDWVFLNVETFQPMAIPAEMKANFFPEGPPKEISRRNRFPAAPPAPPGVVSLNRKVAWSDLDPTGHVNNAQYLAYLDDAGTLAAETYGWGLPRLLEEGFGWVARKLRIEYLLQARLGEELVVTTYLSDMKSASCIRHYLIHYAGSEELVARAYVQWAFVEIAAHRPARIQPQLGEDFAPNISESSHA